MRNRILFAILLLALGASVYEVATSHGKVTVTDDGMQPPPSWP